MGKEANWSPTKLDHKTLPILRKRGESVGVRLLKKSKSRGTWADLRALQEVRTKRGDGRGALRKGAKE